ncbi:hypothetical protein Acsp05_68970 [Actinokineospora sp. NBRC 105648]|nr:hypothetical protein Acsp05_68970 [Actinokineospora sp. NBRC 105648]
MALPTQLNPTEQDALVKQIGLALLRGAPGRWESISVEYRALGRYMETTGRVTFADETSDELKLSPDITMLFSRLRAGMYREGRGTWFNARYQLDQPSAYNLEYDREEPKWIAPPPPPAYADDLRTFPRDEENVPEWLVRRMAALKPPFRVARIFDGKGPSGPVINRPPVAEPERVLRYLDEAPQAMPVRGLDTDHLDEEGRKSVPVAFHTDGTWIWPAAVNYYLRAHGVPPEPDLVEHIRRAEFTVPEVDDQARAGAASFLGVAPVRPPRPGGFAQGHPDVTAQPQPADDAAAAPGPNGFAVRPAPAEHGSEQAESPQRSRAERRRAEQDGAPAAPEAAVDQAEVISSANGFAPSGPPQAGTRFGAAQPGQAPAFEPAPEVGPSGFEPSARAAAGVEPGTDRSAAPARPVADQSPGFAPSAGFDSPAADNRTSFAPPPAEAPQADPTSGFAPEPVGAESPKAEHFTFAPPSPEPAQAPQTGFEPPRADQPTGFEPPVPAGSDEPLGSPSPGRFEEAEQRAETDSATAETTPPSPWTGFEPPQSTGFTSPRAERSTEVEAAHGATADRPTGFEPPRTDQGSEPEADQVFDFQPETFAGAHAEKPVGPVDEFTSPQAGFDPSNAESAADQQETLPAPANPPGVSADGFAVAQQIDAHHAEPPVEFTDGIDTREAAEPAPLESAQLTEHDSPAEFTSGIDTSLPAETTDESEVDASDPTADSREARGGVTGFDAEGASGPRFEPPAIALPEPLGDADGFDAFAPVEPVGDTGPTEVAEAFIVAGENGAIAASAAPFGTSFDAFRPAPAVAENPPPWSRTPAEPEAWAFTEDETRVGRRRAPESPQQTQDSPWAPKPETSTPAWATPAGMPIEDVRRTPEPSTSPWAPAAEAADDAQSTTAQSTTAQSTTEQAAVEPAGEQLGSDLASGPRHDDGDQSGGDLSHDAGAEPEGTPQVDAAARSLAESATAPTVERRYDVADEPAADQRHGAVDQSTAEALPETGQASDRRRDVVGQSTAAWSIDDEEDETPQAPEQHSAPLPRRRERSQEPSAGRRALADPPAEGEQTRPGPVHRSEPVRSTADTRTPPAAALPSQEPPAAAVNQLRDRLARLGVPESRYRIGSPAAAAWTMEQTGEGWRVGWFDERFVAPAMFEDVADASAFLIGKILLDTADEPRDPGPATVRATPADLRDDDDDEYGARSRRQARPSPTARSRTSDGDPAARPEPQATMAAPAPVFDDDDDDFTPRRPQPRQAQVAPTGQAGQLGQAGQVGLGQLGQGGQLGQAEQHRTEPTSRRPQDWPIQPCAGEPPLTLFRGKQLAELPAGTEVDRYGEPDGNLTYAAGTPFERRSLVPDWVNRPYRAYRIVKPTEALTGVAIPWFEQPGGGVAYLLARSITELLDNGHLVEVTDRDAPTRP